MFFYNLGDQVEDERRMDTVSFTITDAPVLKYTFP